MQLNNTAIQKLVNLSKIIFSQCRTLLNNLLVANFFFSNLLFPLMVLILYFVSFEYFLTPVFEIPQGVTYVYIHRSWMYFSYLAGGSALIFFILLFFKKKEWLSFRSPFKEMSWGDIILLLLPITPVIQYVINNDKFLSNLAMIYVIVFFIFFSGIYTFLIPIIFRFLGSTRLLISLGLAFAFSITNMALLCQNYAWYSYGSLSIQWKYFWGCFFLIWLLYNFNEKRILRLLIIVVFVMNTGLQLSVKHDRHYEISPSVAENKLLSMVGDKVPDVTPNIYLLVYDSYVANETMLGYGIDNGSQENYLEASGFELYPQTYSISNSSISTMSTVLNAAPDYYGKPQKAVSGDGIVQNALKSFGYQTNGLFPNDYFFIENSPTYDFSIPEYESSPIILVRAILMGEFRFDVGFTIIPKEQFLEIKQNIFENTSNNPMFIYMHSNVPMHSQNSGACLPNEVELYKKRLIIANMEMRQDVNKIIENDPGAIIIVAGDHGPYLTKNCTSLENEYSVSEITRLDIQDRYGTFLAIRWPTDDFDYYDDITVLQDLFPALFSYLFADDNFLAAKINTETVSSIVTVRDGIINGGINDGEPLFITIK